MSEGQANEVTTDFPHHIWRPPQPGEPREEGGVCIKCGAFANSEGDTPCRPDRVRAEP